jgi:predicted small integral membrane protein
MIGALIGLAVYFLPTLVAVSRHKRNALAIFALNLFLGWTLIFWVVAIVWSLMADPY